MDASACTNLAPEASCTLQLTSIPGMARRGARRLLVEAVRVQSSLRSSGIGSAVMGDPATSVAWLANCMRRYGVSLKKGEVVLSGAFAAALPAALFLAVLPPTAELALRLAEAMLSIGVYAVRLARLSPDKAYRQVLSSVFTQSPKQRGQ